MSRLVQAFVFLLVASLTGFACNASSGIAERPSAPVQVQFDFADSGKLQAHWEKHRSEFGAGLSKESYLEKARAFFGDRSSDKLFKHRPNGDELHYKPTSNEFGVLDSDDTIRTYFKPSSGRRYWDRQ